MKGSLILSIILSIIANIIAITAGVARFYSLCLDVTLGRGYTIVFLPLITLCLVVMLIRMGILPSEYSDELMGGSALLGQLLLMFAVYRLMTGTCKSEIRSATPSEE